VTSIDVPDLYYWAKFLSLKTGSTIFGVQFSADGTLIITHSGLASSNFINVFDVATGVVKSARSYSSGGN
jgi:hypothetical protein